MRNKELKLLITFHTTTAAMAFENACKQKNLPGRLIPVPSEISAGCGLAWATIPRQRLLLEDLEAETQIEISGIYELII